jgi:HAD superfamily hydrolase (TIGR01509 family)
MLTPPDALLFDMDGTLTAPLLDFPRIKAEMGIGAGPILEALAAMTGERRRLAEAVLHRHEQTAAVESTLNPGCAELLSLIASRRIPMALITRNSRQSVQTVLQRHGLLTAFAILITREDGRHKPHPDPLFLACDKLGVDVTRTWMVGDSHHDVEAGLAAGAGTVWLSHGQPRPFAAEPWRTVRDLFELMEMLQAAGKP